MNLKTVVKKIKTSIKSKSKVFVVGFNKTGTTTLKRELWNLGYSIGDQEKAECLLKYWELDFKVKLINYCKTAEAFQDIPFSIPDVYKILYEEFKDAKFILSTRDNSEQWFNSLCNFHSKIWNEGKGVPSLEQLKKVNYRYDGFAYKAFTIIFGNHNNEAYNKQVLISRYEKHNSDVRSFFESNPNSFIEVNVSDQKDYLRLCDFLGKTPKKEGFLWKNKT